MMFQTARRLRVGSKVRFVPNPASIVFNGENEDFEYNQEFWQPATLEPTKEHLRQLLLQSLKSVDC